jgi:hypothetical protein
MSHMPTTPAGHQAPVPPEPQPMPGAGRTLAGALWIAAGLAVLAGGLILWRDRAELVFLDMVASALAMCF